MTIVKVIVLVMATFLVCHENTCCINKMGKCYITRTSTIWISLQNHHPIALSYIKKDIPLYEQECMVMKRLCMKSSYFK